MSAVKIPELIEVWRVARFIGWSTLKTRKFFIAAELASRIGSNAEWMVTRAEFSATMPTLYALFTEAYSRGELVSMRGGKRRGAGRKSTETETSEKRFKETKTRSKNSNKNNRFVS